MKTIKILILLAVPLLISGCADTLKCNIKTNNYKSSIKIDFVEDKPTTYRYVDRIVFPKQSDEAELYYHQKYSEFSALISERYAKVKRNFDKVTTRIKYNFISDQSEKENKLLITKSDTKKNAVKKIESLGYKCE